MYLIHGGELGFGFSKVISYGNALVIDATHLLEYLGDDPETKVICMYLEGVRDGRKLMELVRQINPVKPVIIMKGGMTTAGARAASSHTGSLAGDRRMWDAFFKQTGAIRAGTLEEMAEATMTVLRLKPSTGARVAVLGIGGGNTVGNGDICIDEGLDVPNLSPHTIEELIQFIALVNQGVSNPLDVPSVVSDVSRLPRTLELIAADSVIDIIIVVRGAQGLERLGHTEAKFAECIMKFAEESPHDKPVVVAFEEGNLAATEKAIRALRQAGIIVFPSLPRACRALRRFASYHQFVAESRMWGNEG
jgi:acyl-CoA synthetase (NDP forming)